MSGFPFDEDPEMPNMDDPAEVERVRNMPHIEAPENDPEYVALHEAGHAVAAKHFGFTVERATLGGDEAAEPHVLIPECHNDPRAEHMSQCAVVAAAGVAATLRDQPANGKAQLRGILFGQFSGLIDRRRMEWLFRGREQAEREQGIADAIAEAEALMDRPDVRRAVDAVRGCLLAADQQTIDDHEVAAAIDNPEGAAPEADPFFEEAIHEAGHAVVALHLRFTVEWVRVGGADGGEAKVLHPSARDEEPGAAWDRALIAAAGVAAMVRLGVDDRRSLFAFFRIDRSLLERHLADAGLGGAALEEAKERACDEADRLIADEVLWREVSALALALARRKSAETGTAEMTGAEVVDVVRRAAAPQ